jgi:hypothetical protein
VIAAAEAVQTVVGIGVSYNDYGPYVQRFAVELGRYKGIATTVDDKEVAARLDYALQGFLDAREYWGKDIEFYSQRGNSIAYAGGLPSNLAGTAHIISRYGIRTQNSDIWGINQGASRGVALTEIWKHSGDAITAAKTALDSIGKPVPVVAAKEVDTIDPILKKLAEVGLRDSGCNLSSPLILWRRQNERDVLTADCSTGKRQSVSCSQSECSPFEMEYSEKSWVDLK